MCSLQEKSYFDDSSRRAEQRSAVYMKVHEHQKRRLNKEELQKQLFPIGNCFLLEATYV